MNTARDRSAGLKLSGALLRLDALQVRGFTAHDLAANAGVALETARDFLKRDRGSRYVQLVGSEGVPAATVGRPPNLYRLSEGGRSTLLEDLAEVRRQLDLERRVPAPTADAFFAPLDLLETTVQELEEGGDGPAEWRDRLQEARLELAGCTADLRALQSKRSPYAADFANRLENARARLSAVTRAGAGLVNPKLDLLDRLVERLGSWLHGKPATLQPVLVLLDGIRGDDPVSSRIVARCRAADVQIAAFNVAHMNATDRTRLYSSLDRLRAVTPLAVCSVHLTVDGRADSALELAGEFRELGALGTWHRRSPHAEPDITECDANEVRRFYFGRCESLLTGRVPPSIAHARDAAFAARCNSALSTIAASEAAVAAAIAWRPHPGLSALMGPFACLDASYDKDIQQIFAGAPVVYVSNAAAESTELPPPIAEMELLPKPALIEPAPVLAYAARSSQVHAAQTSSKSLGRSG